MVVGVVEPGSDEGGGGLEGGLEEAGAPCGFVDAADGKGEVVDGEAEDAADGDEPDVEEEEADGIEGAEVPFEAAEPGDVVYQEGDQRTERRGRRRVDVRKVRDEDRVAAVAPDAHGDGPRRQRAVDEQDDVQGQHDLQGAPQELPRQGDVLLRKFRREEQAAATLTVSKTTATTPPNNDTAHVKNIVALYFLLEESSRIIMATEQTS
eukprot:CAMPEP_0118896016 /NCGR_PEP_ID=MMETSP1166-20130328/4091_1 /TAXON_ID=1104430 /ORGANISM="Chrysoreinhardia sp, Strain CCMP3193" /LENGTH=207 /DNA_ID=CAMNT_0006835067 /DNA_START=753 /DNA_END=1374 /DNA_ORIENTATION=+